MTESERDTFDPDVRALIEGERIIEPLESDFIVRLEERLNSAISAGSVSDLAAERASKTSRTNLGFATGLVIGATLGVLATLGVQSLWKEPETIHPRVELTPSRVERDVEAREVSIIEASDSDAVVDENSDVPSVESRASTRPSSRITSRRGAALEAEGDALARERRLLDAARGAIRGGNAEEALATLSRHAQEFESGVLAEEREALTIRALIELGRIGEARMQGAGFRAAYPNSLFLPSLSRRLEAEDLR